MQRALGGLPFPPVSVYINLPARPQPLKKAEICGKRTTLQLSGSPLSHLLQDDRQGYTTRSARGQRTEVLQVPHTLLLGHPLGRSVSWSMLALSCTGKMKYAEKDYRAHVGDEQTFLQQIASNG